MPRPSARPGPLGAAAAGLTGLITIGASSSALAAAPSAAPATASSAPLSAFDPSYGGGARVPGLVGEYLATGPAAGSDGTVIGPDYTQGSLASEAVGREAVQLSSTGQYVQFTLSHNANAIDVDYAPPQGMSGTLSVYVNGKRLSQELQLTAAYSYIDTPQIYGSKTHHFFNDVRMQFGTELHHGDTVRLQADASDTTFPYTINLADFYQVAPPTPQPAHTVSVLSEGADPTGVSDSTAAFAAAVSAANAAHEAVWQARCRTSTRRPPRRSSSTSGRATAVGASARRRPTSRVRTLPFRKG